MDRKRFFLCQVPSPTEKGKRFGYKRWLLEDGVYASVSRSLRFEPRTNGDVSRNSFFSSILFNEFSSLARSRICTWRTAYFHSARVPFNCSYSLSILRSVVVTIPSFLLTSTEPRNISLVTDMCFQKRSWSSAAYPANTKMKWETSSAS